MKKNSNSTPSIQITIHNFSFYHPVYVLFIYILSTDISLDMFAFRHIMYTIYTCVIHISAFRVSIWHSKLFYFQVSCLYLLFIPYYYALCILCDKEFVTENVLTHTIRIVHWAYSYSWGEINRYYNNYMFCWLPYVTSVAAQSDAEITTKTNIINTL